MARAAAAAVKVPCVNTMDKWTDAACAELGIDRNSVDQTVILDLARDVAHGVARPAAPLGTFVLGVAVGSGQDMNQAAERLRELASRWKTDA